MDCKTTRLSGFAFWDSMAGGSLRRGKRRKCRTSKAKSGRVYQFETLEARLALSASALGADLGHDLGLDSTLLAAPLQAGDLISLTVDPTTTIQEVGASQVGLTYWYFNIDDFFGDEPAELNPVFVQMLDNLGDLQGPAPIRIGGGSTQRTWWNPENLPNPPQTQFVNSQIKHDLTPELLDVIKATIDQTGSKMTFGLNAARADIDIFADMAAAIVERFDDSDLDSLEIGNEPDRWGIKKFRPASWDFDDYVGEFQTYYDYFRNNISATAPLSGPAFSMIKPIADDPEWNGNFPNFANLYGTDLASYTLNRYPTTDCSNDPKNPRFPSIENILSDSTSTGNAEAFEPSVIAVKAAGSSFRLTEANTASCGGREGMSDTFASALWFLDATMASAAIGVESTLVPSSVNSGGFYSPFQFDQSGSGSNIVYTPTVNPLYYGMLFFAETVRDGSTIVETDQVTSANVKSWATVDENGVMRVLLINKDLSESGNASISIPGAPQDATLIRLSAPDVESKFGVTIAGQTFDGSTDGLPLGARTETQLVMSSSGTFDFDLPNTSAAILTIQLGQPDATARAGQDLTAFPNNVITLDGLGSLGESLTYQWDQTSGPESVVLTGANQAVATFSALTVGSYTFQLTVDDGTTTDTDDVLVSILDVTADAGPDQSGFLSNVEVTLDGSGSVGSPLTYFWEQIAGPQAVTITDTNQVTATFTPDTAGLYSFRLTTTNGSSFDSDQIDVTVDETGTGGGAFREVNGQVVFEAENYQALVSGQNEFVDHTWEQQTDAQAASTLFMASTPDIGEDAGDTAIGAALEYNVNFTTPGTYYVHVRMRGLLKKSDQLHAGLDQPATYGAKAMRANSGEWEWERKIRGMSGNNRVMIDVDAAGVRQFRIWMREDGVQVDKIVLTTDVNFSLSNSDLGPQTSPFDPIVQQATVMTLSLIDSAFEEFRPVDPEPSRIGRSYLARRSRDPSGPRSERSLVSYTKIGQSYRARRRLEPSISRMENLRLSKLRTSLPSELDSSGINGGVTDTDI